MIALNLTTDEYQALLGLLDAGARGLGIAAITPDTLGLILKLKSAQVNAPDAPQAASPDDGEHRHAA